MDFNTLKGRFGHYIKVLRGEVKRTASIGRTMFDASKANSDLDELYEELGRSLYQAVKNQEHQWDREDVVEKIRRIDFHQKILREYEEDVKKIKQQQF